MARALPTGTVAFVFTDIEGSTALAQTLAGERWAALLARHRELIRAAVAAHDGVEVRTEGDGFFIAFAADRRRRRGGRRRPAGAGRRSRGRRTASSASGWASTPATAGSTPTATTSGATSIAPPASPPPATAARSSSSETTSALVADELPAGVALRGLGEHRLKDLRAGADLPARHRGPAEPTSRRSARWTGGRTTCRRS